ncbi:hypothetical protein Pint_20191 [Pistacia integerrima]|uniref:Uncharacterized protein n=1 Tax=Pistacia integerrima TaxID=434235 RepID=A0ACC0XF51_9ROSI|nr:hypothetical protein Pint_20191 [Pistacia integerrima]
MSILGQICMDLSRSTLLTTYGWLSDLIWILGCITQKVMNSSSFSITNRNSH